MDRRGLSAPTVHHRRRDVHRADVLVEVQPDVVHAVGVGVPGGEPVGVPIDQESVDGHLEADQVVVALGQVVGVDGDVVPTGRHGVGRVGDRQVGHRRVLALARGVVVGSIVVAEVVGQRGGDVDRADVLVQLH